jgi:hypothetical protein
MTQEIPQSEPQDNKDAWVKFSQEDFKVFSILVPVSEQFSSEYLAGVLAYARYTLDKRRFIQDSEKDGTLPTNEEIQAFIKLCQNKNSYLIKNLNEQSQVIVDKVIEERANTLVQEKLIAPIDEIVKNNTAEIKQAIKNSGSFWTAIGASMVASFFYALLITIIIFTANDGNPTTKFARIIQILFESN